MKICFVVNTTGLTGGIKVVFEHANQLQKCGHEVVIVHLLKLEEGAIGSFLSFLKKIKYALYGFMKINPIAWFGLSKEAKILRLRDYKKIPDSDVVVATANETADWVAKLPDDSGRKFYLVQDYEIWTRGKAAVDATYELPLGKIVISSYLKKILKEKFGQESFGPVVNGIDFDFFKCENKTSNDNVKILMQYHILEKKGIDIGLRIFSELKKIYPEIELQMFGAYKLRCRLPSGAKYFFRLSQEKIRDLYYESDIFLWPSLEEGFGLPPMEAMAGKCAVVSFDVGAINDYAKKEETALIVKTGDEKEFLNSAASLIEDAEKRKKIIQAAYNKIQEYTWEKASRQLEAILKS